MATAPLSNLTATWDSIGTTFVGIKLNATDTASAANSLLFDLQVGGASRFNVRKDGTVRLGNVLLGPWYGDPSIASIQTLAGVNKIGLRPGNTDVLFASDMVLSWAAQTDLAGPIVLSLHREADNVFSQRNGVNAQTNRVYSTYTSDTNFQRMAISSARVTLSALSGASATATALIPAGAVVVGVTARVTTEITGSTGFLIGTSGDTDRWGDITGTAVGTTSDNTNWTAGTVECFTAATDVVITEKTANFTAGAIEIAIHYLRGEAD